MKDTLTKWNDKPLVEAVDDLMACCGSKLWAQGIVASRPYHSEGDLYDAADSIWRNLPEEEWLSAFAHHPRIGEANAGRSAHDLSGRFNAWSREEQSEAQSGDEALKLEVAEGNLNYERLFGFTYIVCATGKSLHEMAAIMKRRLENDRETEIREAAEQQRQITELRLRKWLASLEAG